MGTPDVPDQRMRTTLDRKPPSPISRAPHSRGSVDEQLSKLTTQFETLKAQVRQAQQLASLGTAAATIAHEANNLLTPILSYADYALANNDPEIMRKALAITAKNIRILVNMSERLLELNAASPTKRESVSLRPVVNDAIASLCRDLSKDGISLRMDIDDGLTVFADGLQLQQILFNLLLNAREAMIAESSGRLTINAWRVDEDRVAIRLNNTGPAIPADLLPHVFAPLATGKPAARNGRKRCGGLGLALCRDLIEENHGTISVASDATQGTTFTIVLPANHE